MAASSASVSSGRGSGERRSEIDGRQGGHQAQPEQHGALEVGGTLIDEGQGAVEAHQTAENLLDDVRPGSAAPHHAMTQQEHHQHTDGEARGGQDEEHPHRPPAGPWVTQRPELGPIDDQGDQHRQRHGDREELELDRVENNAECQQCQRRPPRPALASSQGMSQQKQQYAGHDRRRRGCGDGTRQQVGQGMQPMPPATRHTGGDVGKADQVGEGAHDSWGPRTGFGELGQKCRNL